MISRGYLYVIVSNAGGNGKNASPCAKIDNIRHSKFLQGKKPSNKRTWVITFDWFVRPNCFPKVLEGQYNDNDTSDSSQQPIINKQLQELIEKQKMDNNAEIIDEDEINRICEEKGW